MDDISVCDLFLIPHHLGSHILSLGVEPSIICSILCSQTTDWEASTFTQDGCEMFQECTHLAVCCTHKGGSGTNKSAQEWTDTSGTETSVHHPAPPGDRTQSLWIEV